MVRRNEIAHPSPRLLRVADAGRLRRHRRRTHAGYHPQRVRLPMLRIRDRRGVHRAQDLCERTKSCESLLLPSFVVIPVNGIWSHYWDNLFYYPCFFYFLKVVVCIDIHVIGVAERRVPHDVFLLSDSDIILFHESNRYWYTSPKKIPPPESNEP